MEDGKDEEDGEEEEEEEEEQGNNNKDEFGNRRQEHGASSRASSVRTPSPPPEAFDKELAIARAEEDWLRARRVVQRSIYLLAYSGASVKLGQERAAEDRSAVGVWVASVQEEGQERGGGTRG